MEEQKHAEIPSNPSLYKRSYFSDKNDLITRSISKFISVIYFSIEITIKEKTAKNGGHVKPGSTVVHASNAQEREREREREREGEYQCR